jgi:hypothetical protein
LIPEKLSTVLIPIDGTMDVVRYHSVSDLEDPQETNSEVEEVEPDKKKAAPIALGILWLTNI